MADANQGSGPRRKRLYLWAAAIVMIFGAVLLAIGEIVVGLLMAIAALIVAAFVWRRSSTAGYE